MAHVDIFLSLSLPATPRPPCFAFRSDSPPGSNLDGKFGMEVHLHRAVNHDHDLTVLCLLLFWFGLEHYFANQLSMLLYNHALSHHQTDNFLFPDDNIGTIERYVYTNTHSVQ